MENISWRPKVWFSLVLAVLVGPFAFLYANSAKWFWSWFVFMFLVGIASFYTHFSPVWLIPVLSFIFVFIFVKKNGRPTLRHWYSKWWFLLLFLFWVIMFLLRAFLFEPFRIPAISMAPALMVGNTVIVKKLGYGSYGSFGVLLYDSAVSDAVKLKRGEIYVFQGEKNVPYIKRLIGLPGDKIEINGEDVYLNNEIIETTLLSTNSDSVVYQEVLGDKQYSVRRLNKKFATPPLSVTVPEKHYFFMGDNRDNSLDSRHYGSISEDNLIGRLVYVIK